MKFNQFIQKLCLLTAMLGSFFGANLLEAFAQFTFMGDYDKSFAAPLGYYVDPQDPVTPTGDTYQSQFYTGEYAPDGSIIAGGRHVDGAPRGDFYLRKFTASGAVDTAFGTGGYVRTNFHSRFDGVGGNDIPQILKVQPDGKILFAGFCTTLEPSSQTPAFGDDACIMRYNANGTLDQSFGGGTLVYTYSGGGPFATQLDPGKVILQTGLIANGLSFGTSGTYYDMAMQPDGKIVLVGVTRNFAGFAAAQGYSAIVVRLNPNGSRDTTFGTNGIARWTAPEGPAGCFPARGFYGVRVQTDGRIIAVGYNSTNPCNGASSPGGRFVVTRWTAAGQLETVRHLDNETEFSFQDQGAGSVHFTGDGSKILVGGVYKNVSGGSAPSLLTMVRFNLSDLSVDTSFAAGGFRQYGDAGSAGFLTGRRLTILAIQPDGRILANDSDFYAPVVRYNPDGTYDRSFGNDGGGGSPGKLRAVVTNFNGLVGIIQPGRILVRPNGRINLIGYNDVGAGFQTLRAVVSQQNTVFKNGVYADFTNDGKTDIAVFRPSNGVWYQTDSASGAFSGVAFGISNDKIAPADYDGDGKTDTAVFRDGIWYILRSADSSFRAVAFGSSGDLPRPGDFDADGLADIAVFRPSNGTWYRLNSSTNQFVGAQFGQNGDAPLIADFDADGKSDLAIFRAGVWYYLQSSDNQFRAAQFGLSTDVPTVGDYDGDGKSDIAVWRPSNGIWYRLNSSTGVFAFAQFGQTGDRPVPGDYDNDGKNDLAVYRGGIWYVQRSGDNSIFSVSFGISTDTPVPAAYLP